MITTVLILSALSVNCSAGDIVGGPGPSSCLGGRVPLVVDQLQVADGAAVLVRRTAVRTNMSPEHSGANAIWQ